MDKVDLLESVLLVLKVIRAGLFLNLNWSPKGHEIDEINRGVLLKSWAKWHWEMGIVSTCPESNIYLKYFLFSSSKEAADPVRTCKY